MKISMKYFCVWRFWKFAWTFRATIIDRTIDEIPEYFILIPFSWKLDWNRVKEAEGKDEKEKPIDNLNSAIIFAFPIHFDY